MIQRMLCWLLGHKTVYKAFTGEIALVDSAFDRNIATPVMVWERSKFCLRCGEKVYPPEVKGWQEKEWREMAAFIVGKTVESVEDWDVGPTFVFTDGSSLELYTLKEKFAWVLEGGEKQRPEGENKD